MGSTKYIAARPSPGGVQLVVDLDMIDVAYELGFETDPPAIDRVLASPDRVAAWLGREMQVTADGEPCQMTVDGFERVERTDGPFLSVVLRFTCPAGDPLVLTDNTVFADDARHQAFVRVGDSVADVLSVGRRTIDLGARPSGVEQALRFLWQGAVHLWTGFDHMLFLLSLLLIAGVRTELDGLRATLGRVALIVTGFTFGHSVTLIAAALEWVTIPSRWVEALIALSILIVALANFIPSAADPKSNRVMVGVAVVFGLVHGFGFSSVLAELALPSEQRLVALLSFNVGIELAQLVFVAIVLGPLAWAARRAWYRRVVLYGGSAVIALIASYWVVERLFFV